jgi:hypothetical protein
MVVQLQPPTQDMTIDQSQFCFQMNFSCDSLTKSRESEAEDGVFQCAVGRLGRYRGRNVDFVRSLG